MPREPTHWLIVPVRTEERAFLPDLPQRKMAEAIAEFDKLGTIIEGPWFHKYLDGDQIMPGGKLLQGPGLIYYAVVEVNDVPTAAGDSG